MARLELGFIKRVSPDVVISDIIGVVIPSDSGAEFPKIFNSYSELSQYFTTDKFNTEKYRILFDSGYVVSANKPVAIENNYSSVRLNNKNQITNIEFCHPKYKRVGVQNPNAQLSDVNNLSDRSANNFILDLEAVTSFNHDDYICFTFKQGGVDRIFMIWFTTIPGGSSSVTINYINHREEIELIDNNNLPKTRTQIIDEIDDILHNAGSHIHNKFNYQIIRELDKFTIYNYQFVTRLNFYKLSGLKYYNDDRFQNNLLSDLSESYKLVSFYSKISGRNGNRISIYFDTHKNEFYVYYDNNLVESYSYTNLIDLSDAVNMESFYIIMDAHSTSDEFIIQGKFYQLSGYEKEEYIPQHLEIAVNHYDHEDVIIDSLLLDISNDPAIINAGKYISKSKDIIVVFNGTSDELDPDDSNLYTYGLVKYLGVSIPSSYFIVNMLRNESTGTIPYNITMIDDTEFIVDQINNKSLSDQLKDQGLNHIRFDGQKYYLQYLYSNFTTRNYATIFTENKVKSRFRQLYLYFGSDLSAFKLIINNIISGLQSSTYLINVISIVQLSVNEDELYLEVNLYTYDLIEEIIKININIKNN